MIKSHSSTWFETKVQYDKVMEDDLPKKVKEAYAVDALSFSEAEERITRNMKQYIRGEFDVVEEKIASYREVFFSDDADDDKWYKCKLQFITIDEKTEKEKKTNVYYLVQAFSLEVARKNIENVMSSTMIDYNVVSITETAIIDVFAHE